MKPEIQRIVIAETQGWTNCMPDQHYGHDKPKGLQPDSNGWGWLPDYLGSLDAMAKVEEDYVKKNVHLYLRYARTLTEICGGPVDAVYATAAQKAEAFLKARSLWGNTGAEMVEHMLHDNGRNHAVTWDKKEMRCEMNSSIIGTRPGDSTVRISSLQQMIHDIMTGPRDRILTPAELGELGAHTWGELISEVWP